MLLRPPIQGASLPVFRRLKEVIQSKILENGLCCGKVTHSVAWGRPGRVVLVKHVQTNCRISIPGASSGDTENVPRKSREKKMVVPDSDPPSLKDIDLLSQFFETSTNLVALTGAGMSTECGIPDYRRSHSSQLLSVGIEDTLNVLLSAVISFSQIYGRPNGAYSSGFKPITHQEFTRFKRARRRYWARSYAGWRKFTAAQPGAAHHALASFEKAGRIKCMITQNVDRLHHRAGSNPLELHGTVYTVMCIDCGHSFSRDLFQEEVKALNPKWAAAIESLEHGSPGSDKSFGMKQRPDGDIEIDEKFWEEDFIIPPCQKCGGVLKPDVIFFGDNVPKDRADKAMAAAKACDAFLVLGSSVMTMSAFRLVRAAHEAGAATAIVNIGTTRADDFVPLKISARLGEILPRVLHSGSLAIPAVQ